eukprot:NODE_31_length_37178_cov_0.413576.p16 type:complete len:241 gc:universal NODE_31_length_37178_cov_0.413576:21720-20998(-)
MSENSPLLQSEDPLFYQQSRPRILTMIYALGFILEIIGVVLVSIWAFSSGDKFIGVSLFSFHPFFMTVSFGFLLPLSIGAFQVASHANAKLSHALIHMMTILFSLIAIAVIFIDHNTKPYKPNLYSAHGWMGLSFICLFYVQYIFYFYMFFNTSTTAYRQEYMNAHRQTGLWFLIFGNAIIISGIVRKQGFLKCGYPVTDIDTNPISHYPDLPLGCRISNWAVMSLAAGSLSLIIALTRK